MIVVKDQSAESSNALPHNGSFRCVRATALVFSSGRRVGADQLAGPWA